MIISISGVDRIFAQCTGGVGSFPYTEDFEINDGGWVAGGTATDWVYGIPGKPTISTASSGLKCWMIGQQAATFYNYGERSYVESPCFNMATLSRPYIQFDVFWEMERQYDGASFQYSIDGGINWINVGAFGDPVDCMNQNWFNTSSISGLSGLATNRNGWSGNMQSTSGSCQGGGGSGGWVEARHLMPYLAGRTNVRFRFIFGSGTTCNDYDGFAFDNLYIAEAPAAISLSPQSTYETCLGNDGSISINVSGGISPYVYNWQPAISSNNTASNLSSGIYTITVTDDFGCNKQAIINIPKATSPTGSMQSRPDTCLAARGMAIATITGGAAPYSYLWNTGETSRFISGLSPGLYTVVVTDSAGCTKTLDATIGNYAALNLDLGADRTFCPAQPLNLYSPNFTTYLWNTGDTINHIQIKNPGTYWLMVTDDKGCIATDTLLLLEDCLNDVLLPNAFTPNGDQANDIFKAFAVKTQGFSLEILDRWGRSIFYSIAINDGWDGKYQGRECPEGVYVWKLRFLTPENKEMIKMGTVSLIR